MHLLVGFWMLRAENSDWLFDVHSLVTVPLRHDLCEFTLVDIGTIVGLAHVLPEGAQCWLVNRHIDFRTFNEIY